MFAGEVYSWGMGSEGQLGSGACEDAPEPARALCVALGPLAPRLVRAGGQHTVLLAVRPSVPTTLHTLQPYPKKHPLYIFIGINC